MQRIFITSFRLTLLENCIETFCESKNICGYFLLMDVFIIYGLT